MGGGGVVVDTLVIELTGSLGLLPVLADRPWGGQAV